ncbi:MAG: HDIG domain-containing protein [Candidatus Omnitrophica bacterium]|nr:HDIG domain-containing protein [Candidatus Omnitrophota bacterium]
MTDLIKNVKSGLNKFSSSYFAKIMVLVVLFLLLAVLIFTGTRSYKAELNEGDISLNDIFAPYDFTYPSEIDEAKTGALREGALKDFLPVYDLKINYWEGRRKLLTQFSNEIAKVNELKDVEDTWLVEKLKKDTAINMDSTLLLPFLQEDAALIETTSLNALNILSSKMITTSETIEELQNGGKEEIIVRDKQLNVEARIPRSDLYTTLKLESSIDGVLIDQGVKKIELREAFKGLLLNVLTFNLVYNQAETESRRKAILDSVIPVFKQVPVKENELIIGKGQKAARTHLRQLERIAKKDTGRAKITYLGGIIILLAVFVIMMPVYLNTYRKKIFNEISNLYLISIIVFLTVFMAKVITVSPLPSYFIPIAAATMLTTILLDAGVSFMLSIMLSVFAGVIAGNKFDVMAVLLMGSMAGVYLIRGVRHRSQILKAGLFVGFLKFVIICGIGLLNELKPEVFLKEGCLGIASGIVASGITMFMLPIFEYIFKISTDVTLLELSDLNHPLLKKMVLSAPGTYHHSLVVGNLAEAASDVVKANSLLARVGAYYHDIGKIEKAEYFSENEASHISTHQKLTPSMSALIIQSHVKDGLELARKHSLNKTIRDFIAQHHGTSLIYYFYQRALEKIGDENTLKEEAFRYPGPKPQTKETAIVLLADAVEASSRTLNDPTPSRIKGLVQKIINNKFIDNQLDECELTLKDLNKIATAFVRVLTGIFHTRVEYPGENKNKGKKKK